MAVLRTYDKQGNLLASGTAPSDAGGICWAGGNWYIVAVDDRILVFDWDGTSGALVRKIGATFISSVHGRSVEMAKHQVFDNEGDSWLEPDGQHIMVSFRILAFGFNFFVLRHYPFDAPGTIGEDFFINLGIQSDYGGVTMNGNHWFAAYTDTAGGGTPQFVGLDIVGAAGTTRTPRSVGTLIRDLTMDGRDFWWLQGSTVSQVVFEGTGTPEPVSSFTAAGAGHAGLTTNSHNLLVLSSS